MKTYKPVSFFRELSPFLLLLVLAMITHWRWFFINDLFSWGDFSAFFIRVGNSWVEQFAKPFTWTTQQNGLGGYNIVLSLFPLEYLFGLTTYLGVSSIVQQKVLLLFPTAILPLVCSYILLRVLTKSKLAGFIGAVVYSYNVYILISQIGGHLLIALSYSLAPLILLLYIFAIEHKKLIPSLLSGLVAALAVVFEFRIFYITAWLLVFYFLYHLVYLRVVAKTLWRDLLVYVPYAVVPFVCVLFLGAYWILPLVMSNQLNNNIAVGRGVFGDGYMYLAQSLTFFFPWWTAGRGHANGVVQPIPIHFWLIPLVVLLGYVYNRKNKYAIYFLFLSVLGVFLTKQSGWPIPGSYRFLYNNFPGFDAYREASKFYLIVALGYSGLIAFFIAWLQRLNGVILRPAFVYIFSVLIFSLFFLNALPLMTNRAYGLFIPRKQPAVYDALTEEVATSLAYYRTLNVPASTMWSFYNNRHPRLNLYNYYFDYFAKMNTEETTLKKYPNESSRIGEINHRVLGVLIQDYSDYLLDALAVKYVILPYKDARNEDDVYANYGYDDIEFMRQYLASLPFLSKHSLSSAAVDIYVNESFKPHIYATNQPESLVNPYTDYIQLGFTSITPTEYKVQVPSIVNQFYLNFSESYDSNWELMVNTPASKILIPSEKNIFGLNSFKIDAVALSRLYGSSSNALDSAEFVIKYKPQEYADLGLRVSLISAALVGVLLGTLSVTYISKHILRKSFRITK